MLIVGNLFRACRVVDGILSFSVVFSMNLNALFCTFVVFLCAFFEILFNGMIRYRSCGLTIVK